LHNLFDSTMTYQETIDYLFTQTPVFQRVGAQAYKPGLENILLLDNLFNHPHTKYKCIHIGGTNGKGSVSNIIASILQEAGYKVGLYTSPHLKDFRERIRINGNIIPESKVVSFIETFRSAVPKDFFPSFFEVTTMMAMEWFAEEQIDIAVMEVGLGGNYDSTNIIRPVASAITNISFDHMALLGNTLELIASEKAGIIKSDVPVIIGKAAGSVRKVFETVAESKSAPLHMAEEEFIVDAEETAGYALFSTRKGSKINYNNIPCSLRGIYQKENAVTVLSLVEVLRCSDIKITESDVMNGFSKVIENTGLRGRWETISTEPRIICDTGHNEAGISFVVKQLAITQHEKLHFVFGMVSDKDVRAVLKLLPSDAVYYFTKASVPRALNENDLALMAAEFGLKGTKWPSVSEAIDAAKKNYRPNDLIFVGGSNFIVAEAI
jgi:dihydrofolate synthase / folylpolyglutamate synthase